jgi:hypothetical protein
LSLVRFAFSKNSRKIHQNQSQFYFFYFYFLFICGNCLKL